MTDTHLIIEAIARAMYDDSEDIYEEPWEGGATDWMRGHYRAMARAALTAALDCMMEPSEGVQHAWKEIDSVRFDWGTAHKFHEAMLAELRKEALGDE